MYYEEKIIDGIMHYRTNPNGQWRAYTIKELSTRYEDMNKRFWDLSAMINEKTGEFRPENPELWDACMKHGKIISKHETITQLAVLAMYDEINELFKQSLS